MAVAVLLEDSAAVSGVFLAASCLWLAQVTGNTMYDALGSIAIGGVDHRCAVLHNEMSCLLTSCMVSQS